MAEILIPDAILDLMLGASEGATLHVTTGAVTDYTSALANSLANVAVGAITAGAGTPSGRQNSYVAHNGLTVGAGRANVAPDGVAIVTTAGTVLHLVTSATGNNVSTGDTINVAGFLHTLLDAAAPA